VALKIKKVKYMNGKTFDDRYDSERTHMETILNNRFNFLLIAVGLFINAAMLTKTVVNFRSLLIICLIYTILITRTLFRAQARLNYLVDKMSELPNHPVGETRDALKNSKNILLKFSVRNLIGYYIPLITILLLVMLILFPDLIFTV